MSHSSGDAASRTLQAVLLNPRTWVFFHFADEKVVAPPGYTVWPVLQLGRSGPNIQGPGPWGYKTHGPSAIPPYFSNNYLQGCGFQVSMKNFLNLKWKKSQPSEVKTFFPVTGRLQQSLKSLFLRCLTRVSTCVVAAHSGWPSRPHHPGCAASLCFRASVQSW